MFLLLRCPAGPAFTQSSANGMLASTPGTCSSPSAPNRASKGKTPSSRGAYARKGAAPCGAQRPDHCERQEPRNDQPVHDRRARRRDARHEGRWAAEPPNEPVGAFAREQARLAASGVPVGVAPTGTVLPDADLLDVHRAPATLYAAADSGTSVLVFYRGAWCPYCNIALSAYQAQLLPRLTGRGIRLIAVSPQKPDGSLTMQQKHSLAFAVVSDPGTSSPPASASSPAPHKRPALPSCSSGSTWPASTPTALTPCRCPPP